MLPERAPSESFGNLSQLADSRGGDPSVLLGSPPLKGPLLPST
jgi:hypothetical protein